MTSDAAREDAVPYGERGVLAYDAAADRIQCHACGHWVQKLESRHLGLHGFSVPAYKEHYGLNASTPLETPRITALRRQANLTHESWRQLSTEYRFAPGSAGHPQPVRAQFRREHYNPDVQREKAHAFTDEEILDFLRDLRARNSGEVRLDHLIHYRTGGRGATPSRNTVIARFGSWRRVCELIGQPYRAGRPRTSGAWRNPRYRYRTLVGAYHAALRRPAGEDGGRTVCLAPDVIPGLRESLVFWTDGAAYRVYEEGASPGEGTPTAVPAVWRETPEDAAR